MFLNLFSPIPKAGFFMIRSGSSYSYFITLDAMSFIEVL
jgi:hypothetical protein